MDFGVLGSRQDVPVLLMVVKHCLSIFSFATHIGVYILRCFGRAAYVGLDTFQRGYLVVNGNRCGLFIVYHKARVFSAVVA